MKKVHILLVENDDNEIDFFSDALEESGLSFLCSIARNFNQALNIFQHTLPDAIFININFMRQEHVGFIKKIGAVQNKPVIFYSTINTQAKNSHLRVNYVQLPGNTKTMAHILNNLFIGNEADNTSLAIS